MRIACSLLIWLVLSSASLADPFQKMHVEEGVLRYTDGSEVNLWGVNFQPSLSWEYGRMAKHGLHRPFDTKQYQAMIDQAFDEIQQMGSNLIRIHLSPSDFSDAEGNLVENQWLDTLDYVMAEAETRGICVYLACLNRMHGTPVPDSFVLGENQTRAIWMIDPAFMEKADNFIHQLLNRNNRYLGGLKYKKSPALAIVEPINEPSYFTHAEIKEFPKCNAVYLAWIKANGSKDTEEDYLAFRYENTKSYINHMVKLFRDEQVDAVMSWSLEWPRAIEWTGEDVFRAAADSDAELISICLYPGQSNSHKKTGEELKSVGEENYLGYLQRTYDDRGYHGWLLEDRFKQKARIVYEFETYYNQSSYLYPAMAKLFRSLGVQAAAMWTYILPGQAEYTAAAHHLNLRTTPNKAAAFIAAGQVFRNEPRFQKYTTTSPDADYSENIALSFRHGCSAYADDDTLVYTESMPKEFEEHFESRLPPRKRIVGRGTSPYAKYGGTGLYFIEVKPDATVEVIILPDARFIHPHYLRNAHGYRVVELSSDVTHPFELNVPEFVDQSTVHRKVGEAWKAVAMEPGRLRFDATPGRYTIKRSFE